jgi:hypothetical protein
MSPMAGSFRVRLPLIRLYRCRRRLPQPGSQPISGVTYVCHTPLNF